MKGRNNGDNSVVYALQQRGFPYCTNRDPSKNFKTLLKQYYIKIYFILYIILLHMHSQIRIYFYTNKIDLDQAPQDKNEMTCFSVCHIGIPFTLVAGTRLGTVI